MLNHLIWKVYMYLQIWMVFVTHPYTQKIDIQMKQK